MPTPFRVASRPTYAHLCLHAFVCWTLAASLGCDRNIEPYQPGEEARQPDLARIFPAPEGDDGPGAAAQGARPAGSGQTTRGAVPPSRAEAGGGGTTAASSASAEPIRGEIRIGDGLAGSEPAGGVLFVIARPLGARGGPPLAVLRIADPSFPLPFTIGPENVMIPSMQFAGAISLSARLDADGNAMTRSEGDISSAVIEPLSPGASGVELVLAEKG